ncbi:MAG: metallophosphoesterase [Nocardioides sp.]|nr:metallophosphoesterase [Nocardioides sp.]
MTLDHERPTARRVGRTIASLVVLIVAIALVGQAGRSGRSGRSGESDDTARSAADTAAPTTTPDVSPTPTPPVATEPVVPVVPVEQPVYTFVSAPDLLNADIGDLHGYPGWTPGTPNSFNKTTNDSLNRLFADMAAWNPDGVFVAGDEVRGHWDVDNAGTGTFGPVRTPEQRRRAIRRAGDFYYDVWKNRFPDNGIALEQVYPAIGDHEIGDNPWPEGSFALDAVPTFKKVWAEHFTRVDGADRFRLHPTGTQFDDTAYASYLTPQLLLVTVDPFAWSERSLSIDVRGEQLAWLRGVLGDAPRGTKILVQGHVPVLTPVRTRGSSALHLDRGEASEFWRVLEEYGVDLYLNGEVHDFTATQLADGGPVQLSHGGLFAHGTTDYVVGRVWADGQLTLDARRMQDQAAGEDLLATMWQTRNNIQGKVRFPDASTSVGSMVIDGDNRITQRTGLLEAYSPAPGEVFGRKAAKRR